MHTEKQEYNTNRNTRHESVIFYYFNVTKWFTTFFQFISCYGEYEYDLYIREPFSLIHDRPNSINK